MVLIMIQKFCRIQNLHISQTIHFYFHHIVSFVEFKIYISLKQAICSLDPIIVLQNSKFTYLSNRVKQLKPVIRVLQNSKFTYLSNEFNNQNALRGVLQNSKFTYLSNLKLRFRVEILNFGIKKWTDTDPGPKAIQIKSLFELECKF